MWETTDALFQLRKRYYRLWYFSQKKLEVRCRCHSIKNCLGWALALSLRNSSLRFLRRSCRTFTVLTVQESLETSRRRSTPKVTSTRPKTTPSSTNQRPAGRQGGAMGRSTSVCGRGSAAGRGGTRSSWAENWTSSRSRGTEVILSEDYKRALQWVDAGHM